MNPLLVLAAVGGLAVFWSGKKSEPKVVNIPKPGPIVIKAPTPSESSDPVPTIPIPPVKVVLPIPSDEDYPTKPPSGNLDPMLDQSEQYSLGNYSNDQLYREGMTSGHLAYVAAIATKLASSGDTRAMDLTLRVANWGK